MRKVNIADALDQLIAFSVKYFCVESGLKYFPCQDPMTPECHDSAISVSGCVAAANSPAEATPQPIKSTPATSPTTSNLNPMISAEFGAGLEDDLEGGGEVDDGDDDALSGRQVRPARTLDYSVITVSSNPGPKPSQEALALSATFTGKLVSRNYSERVL